MWGDFFLIFFINDLISIHHQFAHAYITIKHLCICQYYVDNHWILQRPIRCKCLVFHSYSINILSYFFSSFSILPSIHPSSAAGGPLGCSCSCPSTERWSHHREIGLNLVDQPPAGRLWEFFSLSHTHLIDSWFHSRGVLIAAESDPFGTAGHLDLCRRGQL